MPDISGVCSVFGTLEITTKPMKPASTRIARLVVSVLARISARALPPPGPPAVDRGLRAGVDDLTVAHDAGALDDLVLEVERQLAVLVDEQLQQRLHVAREQLRGVLGQRRRAGSAARRS